MAIITDSTCDIPPDLIEQLGIYIVPLHVIWGDEDLQIGVDISVEQFYERLVADRTHPKTAAPAVGKFSQQIELAQKDGAQKAIIFTLSAALSATHNVALQAAKMSEIPVHVFDTRSSSMGQGWQVLAAARARTGKSTIETLLKAAETVRRNMSTVISVDTLVYLHKGGRIGSAAKWFGSVLDIKPIIKNDLENGSLLPVRRVRTTSRAHNVLYNMFCADIDLKKPLRVAVMHAAAENAARNMAQKLQSDLNPVELIIRQGSPVLGTHTGPRSLALCGYFEDD